MRFWKKDFCACATCTFRALTRATSYLKISLLELRKKGAWNSGQYSHADSVCLGHEELVKESWLRFYKYVNGAIRASRGPTRLREPETTATTAVGTVPPFIKRGTINEALETWLRNLWRALDCVGCKTYQCVVFGSNRFRVCEWFPFNSRSVAVRSTCAELLSACGALQQSPLQNVTILISTTAFWPCWGTPSLTETCTWRSEFWVPTRV